LKTQANADALEAKMQTIFKRKYTSQWGILQDRILPTSEAHTTLSQFFAQNWNQSSKEKILNYELYHSTSTVNTTAGGNHRKYNFKLTQSDFNGPINMYRCQGTCLRKKEIFTKFWFEVVYPKALEIWQTQTVMQLEIPLEWNVQWRHEFTLQFLQGKPNTKDNLNKKY
jgi:hypothetical protein